MTKAKSIQEFLKQKLGHDYNSAHPFLEKDIDYEDIEKWLGEFALQFQSPIVLPTDKEIRKVYEKYINGGGANIYLQKKEVS